MTFPATPLDLRVELDMSGWTNISPYTLQRDGSAPPVRIKIGRPSEQARANPASVTTQWNNRNGQFSPRNPVGPYYGLLGRNTPLRLSVPGSTRLRIADDTTSYASCPATTAMGLTGDLDVRIDMDLDNWQPCALVSQAQGTVEVWGLRLNGDGTLEWTWFDSAGTPRSLSSTAPVPLGRGAVRCHFDPAGTSGAVQVLFYTAPDMAGTWTQLGDAVAIAAGASLLAGYTGSIVAGYTSAAYVSPAPVIPSLQGSVYEVQLYNSAGTLVADPVFSAQTAGVASFADAQGNTWTFSGSAAIDSRAYRVHAECSSLPQRWDVTGTDVWTPVQARGILRRLQQNSAPLPSAAKRSITSIAANGFGGGTAGSVLAYWPCEDAAGSTQIASGLPGGLPMAVSGTASFQGSVGSKSADSKFACSAQLAQVGTSTWTFTVPSWPSPDGSCCFLVDVASGTAAADLLSLSVPGGALTLHWDGSGLLVLNWNGTLAVQLPYTAGTAVLAEITIDSAGDVYLETVGTSLTDTVQSTNAVVSLTSAIITAGTVNPSGANLGTTRIGHITLTQGDDLITAWGAGTGATGPLQAWLGEAAANRFLRLCGENSIAGRVYGYPDLTAVMGVQGIDTLVNILQQCEDTGRGMIYEPSEALGLGYRTLASLCAQLPQLSLDYSAAQLGGGSAALEPLDDDQYTTNDVTVQRNLGSSTRVQVTTGTMSISAPPSGVGDYATQITVYNRWDKDLPDIASWIAHVGTCDEERYPVIPLNLARTQLAALQADILALRQGGYLQISRLLSQLPPGTADQLAWGWTESLGGYHWELALNTVPESPYDVAVAGSTTARAQTAGSQLAAAATAPAGVAIPDAAATGWSAYQGTVAGAGAPVTSQQPNWAVWTSNGTAYGNLKSPDGIAVTGGQSCVISGLLWSASAVTVNIGFGAWSASGPVSDVFGPPVTLTAGAITAFAVVITIPAGVVRIAPGFNVAAPSAGLQVWATALCAWQIAEALLAVETTAGQTWTTAASDFPLDLMIGGELVTAVSAGSTANWLTGANAGFEGSLGDWYAASNCSVAVSSTVAHSGSESMKITVAAAGSAYATLPAVEWMPCQAGDTVTGSAWFRPDATATARTAQLGITWRDASGTYLSSTYFTAAEVAGAWAEVTASATAPASTAWARLETWILTAAAAEVHYVDDPVIANASRKIQAVKVARAVNGVVKAQSAGTAVSVASAPVAALEGNR